MPKMTIEIGPDISNELKNLEERINRLAPAGEYGYLSFSSVPIFTERKEALEKLEVGDWD
ncbi:hypothetical protein ES703_115074 [subsurface metagenome]